MLGLSQESSLRVWPSSEEGISWAHRKIERDKQRGFKAYKSGVE